MLSSLSHKPTYDTPFRTAKLMKTTIGRGFSTDGTYLYFTWLEHTSDIWVMDVEQED